MIKKRLFNTLKETLKDFVFGFNEQQVEVGLFSGNIELKDLILKPNKVNEVLDKLGLPFRLKAGMIAHIQVKVSVFMFDFAR